MPGTVEDLAKAALLVLCRDREWENEGLGA